MSVALEIYQLGCPLHDAVWPRQFCVLRYPFQLILPMLKL